MIYSSLSLGLCQCLFELMPKSGITLKKFTMLRLVSVVTHKPKEVKHVNQVFPLSIQDVPIYTSKDGQASSLYKPKLVDRHFLLGVSSINNNEFTDSCIVECFYCHI